MQNAGEIGDALRTEAQKPSTKQESTVYPFARLTGVLSRMNIYPEKKENIRRRLEEREKSIQLLEHQIVLLETGHPEKIPQQALDGTCDAPNYRGAHLNHKESLENAPESPMQQLEQLLERWRLVDVGVQTDVGGIDMIRSSHDCRQRKTWRLEADVLLYCTSVFLGIISLLNSVWPGGVGKS